MSKKHINEFCWYHSDKAQQVWCHHGASGCPSAPAFHISSTQNSTFHIKNLHKTRSNSGLTKAGSRNARSSHPTGHSHKRAMLETHMPKSSLLPRSYAINRRGFNLISFQAGSRPCWGTTRIVRADSPKGGEVLTVSALTAAASIRLERSQDDSFPPGF